MKKSDFHYELPAELIAQAPLPERSASRLLLVPPGGAAFEDRQVRDLPQLLRAGDLLVFNDTRVIPARLFGHKAGSGGRVEILIERLLPGNEARAQVGASKPLKAGGRVALDAGGEAEVLGREGEFYRLRFAVDAPLETWLQHAGRLPLPPYIHRDPDADDDARYQTVFARETGRSRRRPRGCTSTRRCWTHCRRAGSSLATSRCTSALAPSSRCGSTS